MKYDTSKHQEGTPASVRYAKSMTPGENNKKEKKMKDFHEFRKEVSEATKYNYTVHKKDGKIHGATTDEREAKSMARRVGGTHKKLTKPISQKHLDSKMAMGEDVEVSEGGVESGHKRSVAQGAGLTQKGVDAENRKTGGNLKTAVTTPPSKLKPGSKAAGRRKSFCARSRSWDGERGKAARKRWNC